MAAGNLIRKVLDGLGVSFDALFRSSNGSETGTHAPIHVLGGPGADSVADYGEGAVTANTLRISHAGGRKNWAALKTAIAAALTPEDVDASTYTTVFIFNQDPDNAAYLEWWSASAAGPVQTSYKLGGGLSVLFSDKGTFPIPTDPISIAATIDGQAILALGA